MNVKVLKRLQLAEKAVKDNNLTVPDSVFITYREATDDFHIKEDFLKYDLNGKVIGKAKEKIRVVKELHDYIVPSGFKGTIYLELFGLRECGNLYMIGEKELKEIRKKGNRFAIEGITESDGVYCLILDI